MIRDEKIFMKVMAMKCARNGSIRQRTCEESGCQRRPQLHLAPVQERGEQAGQPLAVWRITLAAPPLSHDGVRSRATLAERLGDDALRSIPGEQTVATAGRERVGRLVGQLLVQSRPRPNIRGAPGVLSVSSITLSHARKDMTS